MMRMILSSFLYLIMLSNSIAVAVINCPDPELVRNILRNGGRDSLNSFLYNKIKRVEPDPELFLQLHAPYLNSDGDVICPYYQVSHAPIVAINMGPSIVQKMEKLTPPMEKLTPPMEKVEKMKKKEN